MYADLVVGGLCGWVSRAGKRGVYTLDEYIVGRWDGTIELGRGGGTPIIYNSEPWGPQSPPRGSKEVRSSG